MRKTREQIREREREYYKAYRLTDKFKNRIRAYAKKRRADPKVNATILGYMKKYKEKNRIAVLTRLAINRAKKKGVEFDKQFLSELAKLRPENCDSCGAALKYEAEISGSNRPHPLCPSLDRIDPSKGYIAGNVGIICWRCNAIKRDGTLSEIDAIAAYMRRRLGS